MKHMLDVLMYLLTQHVGEDNPIPHDEEILIDHLEKNGFEFDAIDKALTWLDGLSTLQKTMKQSEQKNSDSTRLYSKYEINKIDLESRSFLLFLEQLKVLCPVTRELIIDRLLALELSKVDLAITKWVALMVLFNQPNAKKALANMEHLILAEAPTWSH